MVPVVVLVLAALVGLLAAARFRGEQLVPGSKVRVQRVLHLSKVWGPYVAGDGVAVSERLHTLSVGDYVPLSLALGLYAEAAEKAARCTGRPRWWRPSDSVLYVNAAEVFSEMGDFERGLSLLNFRSVISYVEGARRCTRAWILVTLSRPHEALAELSPVEPIELYDFQCEYWLTLAYAQRSLGDLDACEAALRNATDSIVRASSSRNVEFAWAELHRARGDTDRALARYEAGAKHAWRWQGGSGLLNYGTLLSELGRHDDARAAWQQCVTQDPQSLAAIEAKQRLV